MIDQKKLIELVKKIREETGLGIMEIKSAVEEAGYLTQFANSIKNFTFARLIQTKNDGHI